MMIRRRPNFRFIAALLLSASVTVVGITACDSEPPTSTAPPPEPSPSIEATTEPMGDAATIDNEQATNANRWLLRMPLDRLQASISRVAGTDANGEAIYWRLPNNVDGLSNAGYGEQLGRPDYLTRMEEDPDSSALYVKFMRDLARNVCSQMAQTDLAHGPNATRTLWRFAPVATPATDEQITENLQYLILRFWALKAAADAPSVVGLHEVYDAGKTSTGMAIDSEPAQVEGWRGVCIALIESPLFHMD